ncbi:MAG: PTS sugar transporter subunit IIC [Erysipelotrichaceae bacterium]|jgi:PTS system mannose-specific IIC component|nr:PTS sugar transporter subunit IIC [Erysipelotrichaceae bacterium]
MELSVIQIILITLIAYLKMTDTVTLQIAAFNTLICGWLTGLVVGDPETGLYIGATMQLMSMGVVAVGGSSMPDYPIAAIIATTIAATTGQGMEAGLAIGLPVAMLGVNFDVIYKIFNGFLMRKEIALIEEGKFQSALNVIKISPVFYGLCSAIPVLVCVVAGPSLVNTILDFMPAWFTTGLTIAGGVLPGVGMAMLLMYMPVNKYWSFLLVGFVLAAYLSVPVLGIAAVGLAAAYEIYKSKMNAGTASVGAAGGLEDE